MEHISFVSTLMLNHWAKTCISIQKTTGAFKGD